MLGLPSLVARHMQTAKQQANKQQIASVHIVQASQMMWDTAEHVGICIVLPY